MNINDTPGAHLAAASRRQRLDMLAAQAQAIIVSRQDPATGLLPASTAVTVHGDYTHAWVRDNVYSILAVWALGLAYRDIDATRAAALDNSVLRLMRGLLAAMMRQAAKVERFKQTQDPLDALHAKYDTRTGEPVVGDADWGHLQIDATALFVLMLARMSVTGLAVVRQPDELTFVQNLVYYLARAYRTPDFGIWERGHKRNEGVAEVNASSVGMAKAALEAIAGFDPLPGRCPAVQVLADDIAYARETLEGLLPRESASKETDAALLSVIGFPAFAVDDAALVARTRAEIVAKLQGRYGCKRFLRDGHQTVLEDSNRLHYEPGELQRFEHIESEWPLFFTYLLLDAALAGDSALAAGYRARLEGLMQEQDNQRLLPELYFVPAEAVEAERAQPQSQRRLPNDNLPLVWAQSLYLVGVLLQEGYIDAATLRPPPTALREVEVQVALLASDALVQARLAAHGIASQTLGDIGSVRVGYSQALQAAYGELGRNPGLGLSGRPAHRLGSLATSCLYALAWPRPQPQTLIVLPSLFDRQGFYLWRDNRLLVDELEAELTYIRCHWRQPGQPLLTLWISEPMLQADDAERLLDWLRQLLDPATPGVRSGALAELLPRTEQRRLDWIEQLPEHVVMSAADPVDDAAALPWDEAATRPLTATRAAALERYAVAGLCRQLARSRNPYEQVEILGLLQQRQGADFDTGAPGRVGPLAAALYTRAGHRRLWGVLRRSAGLLDIHDETLEDAVAQIVARRKRIALSHARGASTVIDRPLGNAEVAQRLREQFGREPTVRVLMQEFVLLLGTLAKADAGLLQDTLTVRPWHLLLLITGWLAREHGLSQAEAFDHLLDLSPHAILARLREVLVNQQEMTRNLVHVQALPRSGSADALVVVSFPPAAGQAPLDAAQGGWTAWREATGAVMRLPEDFYVQVWQLLRHFPGLVIGDPVDVRNRVDSELARADTTPSEISFALQVEDLLNKIQASEYRQLTVEALLAVSALCRANPQLQVDRDLVVDVVLGTAVRSSWQRAQQAYGNACIADFNEQMAAAWQAFYASPSHDVANRVVTASIELLDSAAEASETGTVWRQPAGLMTRRRPFAAEAVRRVAPPIA